MLVNGILSIFQKLLKPVYDRSFVLQKIDWLIFINILLVIFSSTCASSDNIGYFAIFAIIFTGVKVLTRTTERFSMTLADKFLLIYFMLVIISVAGSTLFALSLKGFFKTLIYIGFYVSFVHYLQSNKSKLKYILLTIIVVSFAESLVALNQNFLSVSEISGWQDMSRLNPEEVMTRVYGSLKPYNPNLFGGYMLAVLPASLFMIYVPILNKHYKTSILGLLSFALCALSIILTGCRGAYVGLFAQLVLLVVLTFHFLKPFYKKIFTFIVSAVALFCGLVIVSMSSLRARIFSIFAMRSDSSNSFRFNVYNSCLDMFKDNWLLGIGVGNQNFREIYGLYMKTGFDALSAYNIYLETAVESGLFALIAFLGFIICNILTAVRQILKRKNIRAIYLTIALVSLVGVLIHGFVDTVFFRPQIQFIFWIMIGIIRVIGGGYANTSRN